MTIRNRVQSEVQHNLHLFNLIQQQYKNKHYHHFSEDESQESLPSNFSTQNAPSLSKNPQRRASLQEQLEKQFSKDRNFPELDLLKRFHRPNQGDSKTRESNRSTKQRGENQKLTEIEDQGTVSSKRSHLSTLPKQNHQHQFQKLR